MADDKIVFAPGMATALTFGIAFGQTEIPQMLAALDQINLSYPVLPV